MKIPGFLNMQFVQEDGLLTPEMGRYNENLNRAMQDALSDNGWTVPQQTSANITTISASMPDGTIWYAVDGAPACLVAKVNGSLVRLSTTPFP